MRGMLIRMIALVIVCLMSMRASNGVQIRGDSSLLYEPGNPKKSNYRLVCVDDDNDQLSGVQWTRNCEAVRQSHKTMQICTDHIFLRTFYFTEVN